MLNLPKQRVAWLDWRFVAGGVAVLIGLAVCGNLPTFGMSAAPSRYASVHCLTMPSAFDE